MILQATSAAFALHENRIDEGLAIAEAVLSDPDASSPRTAARSPMPWRLPARLPLAKLLGAGYVEEAGRVLSEAGEHIGRSSRSTNRRY